MTELNSKRLVVVCKANLSGSDRCPCNCRKCFYGGDIDIRWLFKGQEFVQYYTNKEDVEQDFEDLSPRYLEISLLEQAKLTALQDWLEQENFEPDPEGCPVPELSFDSSIRSEES